MHTLEIQYFNAYGYMLWEETVEIPNLSVEAIKEYITQSEMLRFCGVPPTMVYAKPECGSPIIVKLGGNDNEFNSLRRWFF